MHRFKVLIKGKSAEVQEPQVGASFRVCGEASHALLETGEPVKHTFVHVRCLLAEAQGLRVNRGAKVSLGSYLLLRSGQPLLDVDGQFPGGHPFAHLGHVSAPELVSEPAKKRRKKKKEKKWSGA